MPESFFDFPKFTFFVVNITRSFKVPSESLSILMEPKHDFAKVSLNKTESQIEISFTQAGVFY